MRIRCLQHVPFEGPAAIRSWAEERGHDLRTSRLDRGDALPAVDDLDWLVVMGGPMGVADEATYPWLRPEQALIRAAIEHGRRVLGVCLGAQLIAHAMGARVYRAHASEIGWFPVQGLAPGLPDTFDGFPSTFTPLHWHGDTFDLPPGSVPLARGPACPNQAFQLGRRVIGLQFHLEATPTSVRELVDHCAGEIGDGRWQMAPHEIRACEQRCEAVQPILASVLDFLAGADRAGG